LKRSSEICVRRFKEKSKQYGKEIEQAQKQLKEKGGKITESERHDLRVARRVARFSILKKSTPSLCPADFSL
jgi:hypothetical protein